MYSLEGTVPRRHFCFVSTQLFFFRFFFLARFIAAVSIVSISLVCDSSIVATCPSVPAARIAFFLCVSFVLILLCVVVLSKQNQEPRARLVDRKLVQAPPPPPPAGCPKAALLFWFFSEFICGLPLFIVILVIYKYENR